MKSFWIIIFLAVIQGLTEPIPVSSSGHLVLAQALFGIESNDATLEILLHGGSLIAVILFYFTDIKGLIVDNIGFVFQRKKDKKPAFDYAVKLVIATIPAGIIGLLFKDTIEEALSNPRVVGFTLLFTATILASTYLVSKKPKKEITPMRALIIGIAQAIALLPGVSRSGMTTSTAMLTQAKPEDAMRFSFMMFIPIATLVMLIGIPEILAKPDFSEYTISYLVAIIVSGVVTFYAMRLVKLVLKSRKYHWFSLYCALLGILVLFTF
jgi:undecaprenyl-diphosphatase